MKNILILGGGFGGLQTARKISKCIKRRKLTELYRIILVDKNTYHTFTPTLYETATTTDLVASNSQLKRIVAFSIKEILDGLPVEIVTGVVTEIDLIGGEIKFETGTALRCDWLVLALGSQVNYFNIPGMLEHALPLKTFTDALRIREKIVECEEGEDKPALRVIIGGGGPTGVELAGEIKNLLRGLPRIFGGDCSEQVMIIDGGPSVISNFSPRIVRYAQKRLTKLGVVTLAGKRIQQVDDKQVILQSGEKIPFDVLIWTGGVAPNHLMNTLQLKKDQSGTRILVTPEMVCLPEPDDLSLATRVYGIGDAISFIDPKTGKPTPGVARAAINQGRVVAHNILQEIFAEQELIRTVRAEQYHPINYPYILPIGGKYAIAKFGPILFTGFFAWVVKGAVEFNYLLSIFKITRAVKYWLMGFWIFIRNDNLG